jgi:hypothetical protein
MAAKHFKSLVTGYVVGLIIATASICVGQTESYEQLAKMAAWGPSSRGFQLGTINPNVSYTSRHTMNVVVLVRNSGQCMDVVPPEAYLFDTTVVDSHGKEVPLEKDWQTGELNTAGHPSIFFPSGAIVRTVLHLYPSRYDLSPGTYRLTVSTNIYQGSSLGASQKPVFVHVTSTPITITVVP